MTAEQEPSSTSDVDPAIEAARVQHVVSIGQRIRELRRDRMTLSELARLSNVSIGLLSRLENGVGNPSFAALSAIARALDIYVHAFFEAPRKDQVIVTNRHRITLQRDRTDATVELLVPSLSSRIVGTLLILPPGYDPTNLVTAQPGQQSEFLVEGNVEYRIDQEIHVLETGDFIVFDTGRPHARRNLNETTEARLICCSTEPHLESYFPD